ncbi:hypothetical protein [Paenibacillus faecalis]|uniref:hypothetical protein n=1 Tax=Paenibacillus faecalis TaxID=2079532 RepID=UPI000D10D0FB|nr:hypothetical protein [Paenibacillus faecalis]
MRIWVFAGICDKSDLLMYLCKILAHSGNRVLLLDAAQEGKYAHCIGRLDPSMSVTEFSGFDVACGFENFSALERYLNDSGEPEYDYLVIDVEKESFLTQDVWELANAKVWVSSFEIAGLMKGAKWLEELSMKYKEQGAPEFQRVYLNVVEDLTDDAYIESYLSKAQIQWMDEPIRIPWDEFAFALKVENEHTGRLRIKPLSRRYKRALMELMHRLTELEQRQIRRAFRLAERRQA